MRAMAIGATRSIPLFLIAGLVASCAARESMRAPQAPVSKSAPAEPLPAPADAVMAERRAGPQRRAEIGADFAPGQPTTRQEAEAQLRARRTPPAPAAAPVVESLSESRSEKDSAPRVQSRAAAAKRPTRDRAEDRLNEEALLKPSSDDELSARRPADTAGSLAPPLQPSAMNFKATLSQPAVTQGAGRASGRLMIADATGGARALVPRALRVVSHVQGARVRTVLDYVFFNPSAEAVAGSFVIELPPDAVPAEFSVFDGAAKVAGRDFFERQSILPELPSGFIPSDALGRLAPSKDKRSIDWSVRRSARVVAASEARQARGQRVRQQRPASTLQWGGGQQFTAQVYPIAAGSLRRVVVAYEAPLTVQAREISYDVPLAPQSSLRWQATVFVDTKHTDLLSVPPGCAQSQAGGWTRLDLKSPGTQPQIRLQLPTEASVLRSPLGQGLKGQAFWARVPVPVEASAARKTGRAIFMVDSSASETPAKAARRAALLQALLQNDPTLDEYAIMLFDVRARWLHGVGFRKNTAQARQESLRELLKVYFEGATSLQAAAAELQRSRSWHSAQGPVTVFLLSDGAVTWGEPAAQRLLARFPILKEVRLNAYRFDAEPSRAHVLSALAEAGGGQVVTVANASDITGAAQAHLQRGATLLGVEVEGVLAEDVIVEGRPKQVFAGQVLTVAGRLPLGGEAMLRLRWQTAKGPAQSTVRLGSVNSADLLAPRAWAATLAADLEAQHDPRFDRVLVALAQRYRLVNSKASFVVLDTPPGRPDFDFSQEVLQVGSIRAQVERARRAQTKPAAEGLSQDGLPSKVQDLLVELRQLSDGPALGAPLVHAPTAGGPARARAEAQYRAARRARPGDLRVFEQIARVRALAGDTAGAVRALSTPVERSAVDPAAMRTLGYALLALGQHPAAAELFARLRRQRGFEGQAYLEEALALEAMARVGQAALRYELVLSRDYGARTKAVHGAAVINYLRLLAKVPLPSAAARAKALGQVWPELVGGASAQLVMQVFWATDGSDLDLSVYEPDGRRCAQDAGCMGGTGRLLGNVRDGLGPEIYAAPRAVPGDYDALVEYKAPPHGQARAPSGLLLVVDRVGPQGPSRRFVTRLLPDPGSVLLVRTERF